MSRILKLARTFQGLTQAEVAAKLGLAKSYVSEIEAGKRPVSLQTIRRYAKLLGVPASSLLFFMEEFEDNEYVPSEKGPLQEKALRLFAWLQDYADITEPNDNSVPPEDHEDST